jgi:hypothetical protein
VGCDFEELARLKVTNKRRAKAEKKAGRGGIRKK